MHGEAGRHAVRSMPRRMVAQDVLAAEGALDRGRCGTAVAQTGHVLLLDALDGLGRKACRDPERDAAAHSSKFVFDCK